MAIVEHPKLAPDEHPDEDRGPTGGLTAHDQRTRLQQLDQALFLLGGQLGLATAAMAVAQAVEAPQEKGCLPVIEARRTQPPALAQDRYGHVVHQQIDQYRDAPYQSHIIALISMLQTAVQLFDSRTTELYPEAHGWILLVGCLACVLEEIHPCAHESQPGISNSFSEDLYKGRALPLAWRVRQGPKGHF